MSEYLRLTLSTLQTKTYTFANSVETDETSRNEPSDQDLHYLPVSLGLLMTPHLQQWICPKSRLEESTLETWGERVNKIPLDVEYGSCWRMLRHIN